MSQIEKDNGKLGNRYYRGTKYPSVDISENDIYVITTVGDRYDLLAQQFYGDISLWWIVVIANNGDYSSGVGFNSLFIPPGTQIRIPNNIQKVISDFSLLNSL